MSLAFAVLAVATGVGAQDKPCTKADVAAAEKAIDRVVGWGQLEKAYQDYRQCDSGAIADLYTDALMRLLVEWKKPEVLADAVGRDPQYKAFVVSHIQSPAAKDDRESIYSRATGSCPDNLAAFCKDIAEAAKPK